MFGDIWQHLADLFHQQTIIWGIKILFAGASGRKSSRPWLCQRKRQPAEGGHAVELFREQGRPKKIGEQDPPTFVVGSVRCGSGFYLHEESRVGGMWILRTQTFGAHERSATQAREGGRSVECRTY